MKNEVNILYIGGLSDVIEQLFACEEISISVKGSASEAIGLLKTNYKPDAILSEQKLKEGNAFEIYNFVRTDKKYCQIPFILITDEFSPELLKETTDLGIDDFFVTTLPPNEILLQRLTALVGYKQRSCGNNPSTFKDDVYIMPLSKRVFDIVVAICALIVLSPVLLLTVFSIMLESRGNIFFTSRRVGRKPFNFYKFRSMRVGADMQLTELAKDKNEYSSTCKSFEVDFNLPCPNCSKLPSGISCSPILRLGEKEICDFWYHSQKKEASKSTPVYYKIENDPRVTRVGKFIRSTNIDELPQLINVIKGDMSIVGNRPLPIYEAENLTSDRSTRRFLAPAGLTGLWQVENHNAKTKKMSAERRIEFDNRYANFFIENNYSFWFDMKIIIKTIPVLLTKLKAND